MKLLCSKAIWLRNGSLVQFGDIDDAIAAYRKEEGADDPRLRSTPQLPQLQVSPGLR